MTAPFIADVRRCADIDHGERLWRLFLTSYGLQALLVYRLGRWLLRVRRRYLLWPVLALCWPLYFLLSRVARLAYDIRLELSADIGPGLYIGHFGGIRIRHCQIGANCCIAHLTEIDAGADGRPPVIGDRVWIGAHVRIIGPYRIGSDATIGAGTVIHGDIPAGVLCVGDPARLVRRNYDNRQILGITATELSSQSGSGAVSPGAECTVPIRQTSAS